ncbi:MAG: 50S ribosomal protein L4 [Alphaproteobacteria bacterium]
MKADVVTLEGGKAGSVELKDEIFGLEPRGDILQRMVAYQLNKRRQGTRMAKDRSLVRGSSRKIVRQKGSGGARHGNKKAPQFRKGGKAHGPVVRSHATDLPKQVRKLALMHALSAKAKASDIIVLDAAKLSAPKTKSLFTAFSKLGLGSALVIDGSELDNNFRLAARNLREVDVLPAEGINVYDILRRQKLVLTKAAIAQLEARLA